MTIELNLDAYWFSVGCVAVSLAGFWGFKRLRSLFSVR